MAERHKPITARLWTDLPLTDTVAFLKAPFDAPRLPADNQDHESEAIAAVIARMTGLPDDHAWHAAMRMVADRLADLGVQPPV